METTTQKITAFAQDVLKGLSSTPKKLSSRFFYDARGDELFQQIMRMPEYYLTDCEFEILESSKESILETFHGEPFDIVELGAGDGYKTKVLLKYLVEKKAAFQYLPVDISQNILDELETDLKKDLPGLDMESLQGDYFEVLKELSVRHHVRKLVLYLGSTIGNLGPEREQKFLRKVHDHMNPGDLLLIGFDLKKNPEVILAAYNDPAGITSAFNLNLLTRINRELDADFDVEKGFKHWETYNPVTGATKSYLVSQKEQEVYVGALDKTFSFLAWEAIDVELSQKFHIQQIEKLAEDTGFRVETHYFDSRKYFVDSLWERV